MNSKAPHAEHRLNAPELKFWCDAFLAAELPMLHGEGKRLSPEGAAHLCTDFADAAVAEYRRRKR